MSNLSKRERDWFYPQLIARDGEFCQLCHKTKSEVSLLEIHETKYERPLKLENMRILCHGCNHLLSLRKERIESVNATPEHKKNMEKEPLFRNWILGLLQEHNFHYELDEIIDSGAYTIGVSVETIKRYLRPLCSSDGPFTKPIAWADGTLHIFMKGKEPYYQ